VKCNSKDQLLFPFAEEIESEMHSISINSNTITMLSDESLIQYIIIEIMKKDKINYSYEKYVNIFSHLHEWFTKSAIPALRNYSLCYETIEVLWKANDINWI
jgi:hypothetical protein